MPTGPCVSEGVTWWKTKVWHGSEFCTASEREFHELKEVRLGLVPIALPLLHYRLTEQQHKHLYMKKHFPKEFIQPCSHFKQWLWLSWFQLWSHWLPSDVLIQLRWCHCVVLKLFRLIKLNSSNIVYCKNNSAVIGEAFRFEGGDPVCENTIEHKNIRAPPLTRILRKYRSENMLTLYGSWKSRMKPTYRNTSQICKW